MERFEKAIDPEKMRAWALPYLTDKNTTNNAIILPPKEISPLIAQHPPQVLEDARTRQRSLCVWIRVGGGFGPFERIIVSATNAMIEVDESRPSWIQIKWREGIYYQLYYP